MIGVGFRKEMREWCLTDIHAEFFEIVPENWINRDRSLLHKILELGKPIFLHGVSLGLGAYIPIDRDFLLSIRALKDELNSPFYSDHLAASGDAHQLYDLFPIPFTKDEIIRVSDRIKQVQDIMGCQIAIENSTWYTNIGDIPEPEFLNTIVDRSDCRIILDINNIAINYKNHKLVKVNEFINAIDLSKVNYMHVAGHEYDERFDMYIDTHSKAVESSTRLVAKKLNEQYNIPILLEWDNDIPDIHVINQELDFLHTNLEFLQKYKTNTELIVQNHVL